LKLWPNGEAWVVEVTTRDAHFIHAGDKPKYLGRQQFKLTWHWGRPGTRLPRPKIRLRLTCRELAKPEGRPPYHLQFWAEPKTIYHFNCEGVIKQVQEC
jgi:hypothetical protein